MKLPFTFVFSIIDGAPHADKQIVEQARSLPKGMYKAVISKNTRTSKQNNSLHLFFEMIAESLTEKGEMFVYRGLNGHEIKKKWDADMIKEYVWRPLQRAFLQKESTRLLNTDEIDKIVEPLLDFLAKKYDIQDLEFPRRETNS